jgi:hypothetical protein
VDFRRITSCRGREKRGSWTTSSLKVYPLVN